MDKKIVTFSELERQLRNFNRLLSEVLEGKRDLVSTVSELTGLYNEYINSIGRALRPDVVPDKMAAQRLYKLFIASHELFDDIMVSFDEGVLNGENNEDKEGFVNICQNIVPLFQDELDSYDLDALNESQQASLEHLLETISKSCPCEVCYEFSGNSGFELWQNILSLDEDIHDGLVSNIKAMFSDDGRIYILSKHNDASLTFFGYLFADGNVRSLSEMEISDAADHFRTKFSGASVEVDPTI